MKKCAILLAFMFLTGCRVKETPQPQISVTINESVVREDKVGESKERERQEVEGPREIKLFEDIIFDISTDIE